LSKQTPAELAKLEEIMQRIQATAIAGVQQKAEAQVAAVKQEAQQKVVAAEAKAKQAEAVATAEKKNPGWFSALLTLKRAGERPDEEQPMESKLVGSYRGFKAGIVINLENGTRWVLQNHSDATDYYPPIAAPKVKIVPAAISGFWISVEGVPGKVRVKPYEPK
jgi:hypothetical protein